METEMSSNEPQRNDMSHNLDNDEASTLNNVNDLSSSLSGDNLGCLKVDNDKTIQTDRRKLKRESDPEYREKERLKNLERTRKLRSDPEFRDRERQRNMLCKRKVRLDPNYREAEKMRNRLQKRKARENPSYREAERKRNICQKRKAREDITYRIKEKMSGLERKCKTLWNISSDEWIQLGPVQIDSDAQVALEHGLYRLIPEDKQYPPEEFSGWTQTEKDLFTKLYFTSRNPNFAKLSETPANNLNQIDHNNYFKRNLCSNGFTDFKHIRINNNTHHSAEPNSIYDSYDIISFSQRGHFLDTNEDTVAEIVNLKNKNIVAKKIKNIYNSDKDLLNNTNNSLNRNSDV